MSDVTQKRAAIIAIGRRLYERGFIVATDGNVSVRLSSSEMLITRSGVGKEALTAPDVVRWRLENKPQPGSAVSSECRLHQEVYHRRPDAGAVIHAHPPYVVALSLAGLKIPDDALPEVVMLLGSIPTAPFAPPSSASGAKAIRKLILTHDAIILDRHGALTIGKTLTEAWFNLERLEYAARVTLLAHTIGAPKKLTPTQKKQLVAIAAQYRLTK